MTAPPEPPPARGDESGGSADDRFDRRIAFGVVAAIAVVGAVGPFGWHLLSNNTGSSKAAAAVTSATNGGGGGGGGDGATDALAAANHPA